MKQMPRSLDLTTLLDGYRGGALTPTMVMEELDRRMDARGEDHVWIHRLTPEERRPYLDALADKDPATSPLFGIPFAIKDNIDLAGVPTTAGCPDYAYTPTRHATVVQHLIDAGAIPLGKTNLDQFATGLVGVRSPYGVPGNSFDPDYIPGGSSAGSAVAVAAGLAAFSLGTDTAGSGRIPAAFNNLMGVKPTRGLLSNTGVVPACRSLDCVSIFALCAADGQAVLRVAGQFDAEDAYARPSPRSAASFRHGVVGVLGPDQLETFGDEECAELYRAAVASLEEMGWGTQTIDFTPFSKAAVLLYEGPWVTERYVAIESFLNEHPESVHPVTREIIEGGAAPTAADAFKAAYRLAELRRASEPVWNEVDFILTPTAGTIYTIAEVEADPVRLNSRLGTYMNFMNLLDLAAVAVPAGFKDNGLPLGVTLFAPAWQDEPLLDVAGALHPCGVEVAGATGEPLSMALVLPSLAGTMELAVCGAHLLGEPLNHQLTERGGVLVRETRTADSYRFHALAGTQPPKPGLVHVEEGGAKIEVEVWALPLAEAASFIAAIPSPLAIGTLSLEDGTEVSGFLCEPRAIEGAADITALGGWRAYMMQRADGSR